MNERASVLLLQAHGFVQRTGFLRSTRGIFAARFHFATLALHPAAQQPQRPNEGGGDERDEEPCRHTRSLATRLLRQPHGFEGLCVIPEVLLVDDFAPAQREDERRRHVHVRAAPEPTPGVPYENVVRDLDEVCVRFNRIEVLGFAKSLEEPHHGLATYIRSRLRPIRDRLHDDIRVVHFTEAIHVPGVPCVEHFLDDLHVLLRNTRSPARKLRVSSVVGDGGYVVMTSPATLPTPRGRRL